MARAFVAVVPPPAALDAVAEVSAALSGLLPRTARRSRREQWHVTLQFLGDHVDLDAVAERLDGLALAPGAARLGGIGAFPSARRARVVWLGVLGGAPWLAQAAAATAALLAPLGHEPEDRDFRPHVTLARTRGPTDLRRALERLGALAEAPVGPQWAVSSVVLVESRRESDGPRYRVHHAVTLA